MDTSNLIILDTARWLHDYAAMWVGFIAAFVGVIVVTAIIVNVKGDYEQAYRSRKGLSCHILRRGTGGNQDTGRIAGSRARRTRSKGVTKTSAP